MSSLRETMLEGAADPVLPFSFIKADLGVSHATFHRSVRHELPVVQISDRRLGVRRSDYEKWKASRVRPGRAA
jgi:hypothetical protein